MKEILKGEALDMKFIDKVDFESVATNEGISITDKFNEYYINSIHNIKQIGDQRRDRELIYEIENKILEYFNLVNTSELERIVMTYYELLWLPAKKGTEEEISVEMLKIALCVIKDEFTNIINKSLTIGECPNSWKHLR